MPRAEGMLRFAFSDAPGAEPGFRLDGQGRVRSVHGIEELGQSLTMLLSTRPGERPLAPDYGCPLDLIAFEPNDATTAGLAIRLVADAVERFEPRAEILMIDAGADPGGSRAGPGNGCTGVADGDRARGERRLHDAGSNPAQCNRVCQRSRLDRNDGACGTGR